MKFTTFMECLGLALAVLEMVANLRGKERHCNTDEQLTEMFDSVYQNKAIEQLNELRGKIVELKTLASQDISQSVLLNELESIKSFSKNFTNKYLEDFAFEIPSTSNVEEICEEMILQIDDQIHTIEYGAKGE